MGHYLGNTREREREMTPNSKIYVEKIFTTFSTGKKIWGFFLSFKVNHLKMDHRKYQ